MAANIKPPMSRWFIHIPSCLCDALGMKTRGAWNKPVTLELHGIGKYRSVTSTKEAAEVLMERWPVSSGVAFEAALLACLAVLEGEAEPDMARVAFIAAAEEAGIYVMPG